MSWIAFIKNNIQPLQFGLALTLFSGFGQTFLIALFVPFLSEKFQLSNGAFGSLYGLATLCSGFALTILGKAIDKYALRYYTAFTILLLATSLMLMGFASHVAVLFISLFGMRLAGQGLMTHISITTMSRHFHATRGKALSITSLGHPMGEALFPVLISTVIYSWGWQEALLVNAVVLLLIVLPYVSRAKFFQSYKTHNASADTAQVTWTQRQLLKSKVFYKMAPNSFVLSMITTAVFFYQVQFSQFKGWSPQWFATCFIAYAVANSASMLISGTLVDRFSARRIFPYYLLPFAIGLALVILFNDPWIVPLFLVLTAISVGLGSTIKSAIQAEMFGTNSLGAVRSLFGMIIVLSTAVGPALFGLLLDIGFTFDQVLMASLVVVIGVMIQSFRVLHPFRRKRIYVRFRIGPMVPFQKKLDDSIQKTY